MKNSRQYHRTMFKVNDAIGKYDLYTMNKYDLYTDEAVKLYEAISKLRPLAKKHHRLAEMSCNGVGVESQKTEDKIKAICQATGLTCEFQGDPRGDTVKVSYNGRDLSDVLWA